MLFIKKLKQPDRSPFTSAYSLFLVIIIAAGLALGGCGDETIGPGIDDENDINDDRNVPEVVRMVGQSFSPSNLQVVAGTTVAWENDSDLVHTVTSGPDREHDENFNSGDIAPGESYSYTFNETGTFPYFCIPHPGMQGTITVVEDDDEEGDNDNDNDNDDDDDGY